MWGSRCHSATKLRNTLTPRIKDGRMSNEMVRQASAGPIRQVRDNPQSVYQQKQLIEHAVQKKLVVDVQKKLVVDVQKKLVVDVQKKLVVEPMAEKREISKNQYRPKTANHVQGRKLQYPKENIPKYRSKESSPQEIKRSHSTHFVDRTCKSREIKRQKAQFQQKFQKAFQYLIETNSAYLNERRRACIQKARPKDQWLKISHSATKPTYKDHYPPKQAPYQFQLQPQNEKMSLLLGEEKVCFNSSSHEVHAGTHGPKAQLSTWAQGFKLQGPLDSTTTYANKFPHPGCYSKMVPIATFNEHPKGMPHTTNSTYRTLFQGQPTTKAELARWNNLHPYGNAFDPNRSTTYKCMHCHKAQLPIQKWPNYDPKLILSKGKFTTQYRDELNDKYTHLLNQANYCICGRKWNMH